jgi:hypothetical protein
MYQGPHIRWDHHHNIQKGSHVSLVRKVFQKKARRRGTKDSFEGFHFPVI